MLAMANAGTPAAASGTNGSQFFITTVARRTWLQGKHTIFGEVADDASKAVVEEIERRARPPAGDRPIEPVVISSRIDIVAA